MSMGCFVQAVPGDESHFDAARSNIMAGSKLVSFRDKYQSEFDTGYKHIEK